MVSSMLKMSAFLRLAGIAGFGVFGAFASAQAVDPITLHFYDRRPFQYMAEDSSPAGSIVDMERQVFKNAGIPVTWVMTPVNRIMRVLQDNRGMDCSAAWARTPERELFAKFTIPVVDATHLVGLVRSDLKATEGSKAKDVFALPSVQLLLKQGLTYGDYLDGLIADIPSNRKVFVSDDMSSMVRMLTMGTGNIVLTSLDEAQMYVSQTVTKPIGIRVLKFPDVPALGPRSIICSRNVSDDVMKKLNVAIKGLPKSAH